MRNIDTIRQELERQLATLVDREARIEAHQHNTSREIPKDWDDAATVRENDEVVDRLEEHTRRDIVAIKATLRRMEAGDWGDCARCGDAISPQRLVALPTAALCIDCAEVVAKG